MPHVVLPRSVYRGVIDAAFKLEMIKYDQHYETMLAVYAWTRVSEDELEGTW